MSSTTESSTEVRTLQSRATHAEKRAATLANQLSALQEASATHESRHQTAVSKWEARVREYEKRLRRKGEGGGSGAATQVSYERTSACRHGLIRPIMSSNRSLSAQRDAINAKTIRLESIMNMAGMGRKDDPDAL
jgi:DNA repair exonuclease SbcCD ATPase subunit